MTERTPVPPMPDKAKMQGVDDLISMPWRQWFGVLLDWMRRVRVYTFAVDVPSIPAGDGWWGQATCDGASVGDFAIAALDPVDRDLAVTAQVTAANTVTVWVRNYSGSAIDLAAGTLWIRVEKAR